MTLSPTQTQSRPAAGTWEIDQSHTVLGFQVRHLMVAKVRGRFADFSGTVTFGDRPEDTVAEVTIATASVDSGDPARDEHLRNADFFDVEQFPAISFRSTGVRAGRGDRWILEGDLTIRDVTAPVSLDVEFEGVADDPWGGQRAGFTAVTEVDREAWGLTWNQALEAGGFVVGKKVRLELDVELVRQ